MNKKLLIKNRKQTKLERKRKAIHLKYNTPWKRMTILINFITGDKRKKLIGKYGSPYIFTDNDFRAYIPQSDRELEVYRNDTRLEEHSFSKYRIMCEKEKRTELEMKYQTMDTLFYFFYGFLKTDVLWVKTKEKAKEYVEISKKYKKEKGDIK